MTQKLAIDNKELYLEIKLSKGLGKLTPRASAMFYQLARNVLRKMQYHDDDDRLDCFQTALLNMYSNWHNFNPDKFGNAFAYMTEICKRGLAQGFKELHEKRGQDKGNYRKNISISGANNGQGMHNI